MRKETQAVLDKLIAIRDKVDVYLDTAENADNPNEDRIDELENELEALNLAIDALES